MPIDLSGIQNVGEFYSHHYLDAKMTADGGNTRWERRELGKYTQEQNQSAGNWETSELPSMPRGPRIGEIHDGRAAGIYDISFISFIRGTPAFLYRDERTK